MNQENQQRGQQKYNLLTGPYKDQATSLRVNVQDLWPGINLWLALHSPVACQLTAMGTYAEQNLVPDLFGRSSTFRATVGLFEGMTLCILARSENQSASLEAPDDTRSCLLGVRSFGPDEKLAEQLIAHLMDWERAGRPSSRGLRIRAYPLDVPYVPSSGEIVIAKRLMRLVLDWPRRPQEA